ncbi:MAG: tripartite tricarboxylate transporter permease [Bacillota bacterium]
MEALGHLWHGFSVALSPINLLYCAIGSLVGTLVGVLPGLGSTATIAILLPVLSGLPPATAIIALAGIYYGAMYGGSTTAILINTPGEAASVITAADGYAMARQGRAGPALGMAAVSSFVAGTLSLFGLVLLAPPLADAALTFGPAERFALMVLGLSMVISLAGESLQKGLLSGLAGLLVGMVGLDPMTGVPRFTLGSPTLLGGIDFISVIVGLFAIAEIFVNVQEQTRSIYEGKLKGLLPTRKDLRDCTGAMGRSTIVGFLLGLLPGVTPAVASFLTYDIEKKFARDPSRFGHGAIEGVAAAEGANNSATSGGLVPLFTLGIPTTPALAVLLGGLMIYGLQPGPLLFEQHADFAWPVIASMYIGNVMLLVLNLPLVGLWAKLTQVPYPILSAGILGVCVIGTYGVRNNVFDVWMMVVFGVVGFLMKKWDVPAVPLVIALVLSEALETSLRQALKISGGSLMIFTRPLSLAILLLALASFGVSLYSRAKEGRLAGAIEAGGEDVG